MAASTQAVWPPKTCHIKKKYRFQLSYWNLCDRVRHDKCTVKKRSVKSCYLSLYVLFCALSTHSHVCSLQRGCMERPSLSQNWCYTTCNLTGGLQQWLQLLELLLLPLRAAFGLETDGVPAGSEGSTGVAASEVLHGVAAFGVEGVRPPAASTSASNPEALSPPRDRSRLRNLDVVNPSRLLRISSNVMDRSTCCLHISFCKELETKPR